MEPQSGQRSNVDTLDQVIGAHDAGSSEAWWAAAVPEVSDSHLRQIRKAITVSSSLQSVTAGNFNVNGETSVAPALSAAIPTMPSITESSLELDFTTPGVPSKLDCPFNALAKRRLSPHAASVVARYRPNGTRTPRGSVSRIDGRASSIARSALGSGTDQDGGICGALEEPRKLEGSVQAAAGVCPIRFLDKNTPEEIAEYFVQHKHEVPRSHEVCVKRYQGDSKSIQELDAKYGNLVSMIKGLGEKHAPMLPGRVSEDVERASNDKETDERVRKWSQAIDPGHIPDPISLDEVAEHEQRTSHFDRPMKEVRVGESPSRPWGIHVPTVTGDAAVRDEPTEPGPIDLHNNHDTRGTGQLESKQARPPEIVPAGEPARCPFGFGTDQALPPGHAPVAGIDSVKVEANAASTRVGATKHRPIFIAGAQDALQETVELAAKLPAHLAGPVFIGYSATEALKVIKGLDAL